MKMLASSRAPVPPPPVILSLKLLVSSSSPIAIVLAVVRVDDDDVLVAPSRVCGEVAGAHAPSARVTMKTRPKLGFIAPPWSDSRKSARSTYYRRGQASSGRRPRQTGGRLSRNAATPSLKSSLM